MIQDSALEGHKKTGIKKCSSLHLYMMWSEEKLTIEIRLFYKVWICDAHLRIGSCREKSKVLASKHVAVILNAVIYSNAANSYLS